MKNKTQSGSFRVWISRDFGDAWIWPRQPHIDKNLGYILRDVYSRVQGFKLDGTAGLKEMEIAEFTIKRVTKKRG